MRYEIIEVIGYLGSAGVMCSFLMKEVKPIRCINMIGCVFFVLYGVLLGWKWPIIIPNAFVCCTHLYFLLRRGRATRE